jgi:hypothetical protein
MTPCRRHQGNLRVAPLVMLFATLVPLTKRRQRAGRNSAWFSYLSADTLKAFGLDYGVSGEGFALQMPNVLGTACFPRHVMGVLDGLIQSGHGGFSFQSQCLQCANALCKCTVQFCYLLLILFLILL